MKAKTRVVVLAALAVLIPVLWAVVRAGDKTEGDALKLESEALQRNTLRGLQGVYVVVGNLKPEVEQLGLTTEALRTDTELQLRQYGIKVLSYREFPATPGWPYLYVNVNVNSVETVPILAVGIEVELNQRVSLERDAATRCFGATWFAESIGTVGRSKLGQVRDSVKDLVASFINDYLAVNPKEGKAKEGAAETKP